MRDVIIKYGDSLDAELELVEYEDYDGPELRQPPYDMLPMLSRYREEEDGEGEIEFFLDEDEKG